jgi:integrase
MASISTDAKGLRKLQFTDPAGVRKTVYLGKMTAKNAATLQGHVEKLLVALISQGTVEPETAQYIRKLEPVLYTKLSRVGLVASRGASSLEAFVDDYIASRNDAKPATKTVWNRTRNHLLAYFDGTASLRSISKSAAKGFRQYLIGKGLAENTVRRTCGVVKQFFADALDRELIEANPFKQRDIPTTTGGNQERQAYITRETAKAVLDACPDAEWRLLFALSRFAGLRCPSEHLSLRWEDLNWDRKRMTVRSPKTEHHEGGAMRIVPIFPELRPYLEEAQELYGDKSEFVICRYRSANANLGTQLLKIINRAGVKPWPKLFHNLRASCETDLAKIHPIKAVCDWIGNSITVAQKHYLQTTEDDFERAAGYVENPTQNPTQQPSVRLRDEPRANLSRKEIHWKPSVLPSGKVGDEGPAAPRETLRI